MDAYQYVIVNDELERALATVNAVIDADPGYPDYYMDQCFASNPPGALLDAQVIDWREADAKDAN